MIENPGGLAAGLTAVFLFSMGLVAVILTTISRRRQRKQEDLAEEGQIDLKNTRITSKPPQLPRFKTRSSLSMSSGPHSPKSPESPKSPGFRFTITTPSHRSRQSGSIDSLPGVETILEQYEKEAAAAEEHVKDGEEDVMLPEGALGEPGPSVPSDDLPRRKSR